MPGRAAPPRSRAGAAALFALAVLGLVRPAAAQDATAAPATPGQDRERAVACLAEAIAHEAPFEPLAGQQAVAEVILNRVRDPLYPKTVCGVVFAGVARGRRTGCQFSFACDGSLGVRMSDRVMAAARAVAAAALDGANPVRVPGATHYHAFYVSPYWAPSLVRIGRIGAHIFYRLPAGAARAALAGAFTPRGEPLIAALTGRPEAAIAPAASMLPASAEPARFAPWGLPMASATPR